MKRTTFVIAVALIAVLCALVLWGVPFWAPSVAGEAGSREPSAGEAIGEDPPRPTDAVALTVERVVDGDTLRAHAQEVGALLSTTESQRVRLIGIDTPEISGDVECWGAEATEALRDLAPVGSTVWAAADVETHDRYDRWLFYLWTEDGRFINRELVASGAAGALDIAPNSTHAELFASTQADARWAGAGQWGGC